MSQGAAGALSGAYDEQRDAFLTLCQQVKMLSGAYQKQPLNAEAPSETTTNEEDITPATAAGAAGGGSASPPNMLTTPNSSPGSSSMGGRLGSAIAGAGVKVASAVGNYGTSKLGDLLAENTFTQLGSYMGPASAASMLKMAVGSGGKGYNLIANNTADAMQQFNILQQASGSQMLSNPIGRAMKGASFAAGYINPGMGGAASAQFAAQVYSPSTSLYMRQFGIGPLQPGGGQFGSASNNGPNAMPIGTLANKILSTMTMGQRISNKQLPYVMRAGAQGQLSYNTVTAGQIPLQTMLPIMEVANTLKNQGVSQSQANWAIQGAGQGNANNAQQKFLTQHGVPASAIMKMHEALAPDMARTADQYGGMQQGLSYAATAVQEFNTQFSKFMKDSGLDTPTGFASGFVGGMKALEPGLTGGAGGHGGLLSHLILGRALWKIGSKLFKSFGARTAAEGAADEAGDTIAEAGSAGLGEAAGIVAAPAAVAAAGIFMGVESNKWDQWMYLKTPKQRNTPNNNRAMANYLGREPSKKEWRQYVLYGLLPRSSNPMLNNFQKGGSFKPQASSFNTNNFKQNTNGKSTKPLKRTRRKKNGSGGSFGYSTNVVGGGFSAQQDQTMLDYMRGEIGKPYSEASGRFGPNYFDCSGLVFTAAKAAGINMGSAVLANTEIAWLATHGGGLYTDAKQIKAGDVLGFTGASPIATPLPGIGPIGHIGMADNTVTYVSAYDSKVGVADEPISGDHFVAGIHMGGATSSSAPSGNGGQGFAKNASSGSAGGVGGIGGTGDNLTGGSTAEKAAFMQAITGGISGGSGYTGQNEGTLTSVTWGGGPAAGTTAAGGAANAVAGSTIQNGTAIYNYLLANLFGGSKVAAAGAIASIYGESTWNPESAGTGGNGLIGWTPPLPGIITGNATADLNKQLPLIIAFVNSSGDQGVISQMKTATSLLAAANLWGKGVERYGINDVHPQGLALAAQIAGIANNAAGGNVAAGQYSEVGERGPELVLTKNLHKNVPPAATDYTYSTAHPLYSGGVDLLPSNHQIVLHFKANSIKFNVPPGTTQDSGSSSNSQMAKAQALVDSNTLHTSIANGVK